MSEEKTDEEPEEIRNLFPEGDKRRGDAIVVNDYAYTRGKKEERERIIKEIDNLEVRTARGKTRFPVLVLGDLKDKLKQEQKEK